MLLLQELEGEVRSSCCCCCSSNLPFLPLHLCWHGCDCCCSLQESSYCCCSHCLRALQRRAGQCMWPRANRTPLLLGAWCWWLCDRICHHRHSHGPLMSHGSLIGWLHLLSWKEAQLHRAAAQDWRGGVFVGRGKGGERGGGRAAVA
jgi:hypothetical protein